MLFSFRNSAWTPRRGRSNEGMKTKRKFPSAVSRPPDGSPRREFLKRAGLAAGVLAFQPWRVMAGPFTREDFDQLVPADKKNFRRTGSSHCSRAARRKSCTA